MIVYSGNVPKAIVKDKLKLNLPAPGENPIGADFFDIFRDTHEKYPVSTEVGAWGGQEFVRILGRHMARKQKFPDEDNAKGVPYDGIENLRPETMQALGAFKVKIDSIQR